tara:strand:+ start:220 stop:477 length:258 start_codon:yes stop_codon:yes gene_type:complete
MQTFNDSEWRRKIRETSMTRGFTAAVEKLKKVQLQQQELRKDFVKEQDPKKKEQLKNKLVKLHKDVQKAEAEFNKAVLNEPIDLD